MTTPVNCTEAELAEYLKNLKAGFTCEPCIYSPEPVAESSPTNSLGTPRSARSRSMSIASKPLRQGKRTAAFPGFPSLRMSSNLTVGLGAGWLILSPVDSRAPIFHWPGRARVSMGSNQDCGPKWPESLARFDPVSRSWKTAQRSLLGDSGESSVIWPRSGMTADGQCWELPKSERPTSATGSGLWPTPTATLGTHGGRVTKEKARLGGTLIEAVSSRTLWPTPRANDAEKRGDFDATNPRNGLPAAVKRSLWPTPTVAKGGPSRITEWRGNTPYKNGRKVQLRLEHVVKLWPTPTKSDGSGGPGSSCRADGLNLRTAVAQWPTPTVNDSKNSTLPPSQIKHDNIPGALLRDGEPPGGQLNPAWVERMMGWPDGWTDLALREPVPVPTGWGEDWEGDVPRTVTGVPHRTSRLKALGNGQVPQAAAAAWLMLTQKSRLTSGRQW